MKKPKPRIFIGCSKEAIPIAAAVHEQLRPAAEVTPWYSGVFDPSNYTMEDLEKQVESNDFAIFIFHPDDVSLIRKKYYATVRDNTIFEMGLFMSKLGRRRVFFILPDEVPETADDRKLEGLRTPSDLFGINPLTYEIRTDGKWAPAVSVACSKIAQRLAELGKWSDEACELKLHKMKEEMEQKQIRLLKVVRFFREIIRTKQVDLQMLHKISDTVRTTFTLVPPFNVRGVALYRANDDGYIEQLAGNVGEIGRKYPLNVNDHRDPDDPKRILVVDSHQENKIKVTLYEDHIEKEYLLCYPVAKRYVITVHIIGHLEADAEMFKRIDMENEQLFSTIHDLLGGE